MPTERHVPDIGELPDIGARSLRAVQDAVEGRATVADMQAASRPNVVTVSSPTPPNTANYRVVSNGLADLQKRLDEVKGKCEKLHKQLVGGEIPSQPNRVTAQPNGTVFDHLAYQCILLARLVGEVDALVSRSGEALK